MDIGVIRKTFQGINELLDVLKNVRDLSSVSKIVTDLRGRLADAQNMVLALQSDKATLVEKKHDLEKKIVNMETWETEKQRYALYAAWEGCLVYALKKTMSSAEPPHYLCTNCYEDRRKSILVPHKKGGGFWTINCPECETFFDLVGRQSRGILFHYV